MLTIECSACGRDFRRPDVAGVVDCPHCGFSCNTAMPRSLASIQAEEARREEYELDGITFEELEEKYNPLLKDDFDDRAEFKNRFQRGIISERDD